MRTGYGRESEPDLNVTLRLQNPHMNGRYETVAELSII